MLKASGTARSTMKFAMLELVVALKPMLVSFKLVLMFLEFMMEVVFTVVEAIVVRPVFVIARVGVRIWTVIIGAIITRTIIIVVLAIITRLNIAPRAARQYQRTCEADSDSPHAPHLLPHIQFNLLSAPLFGQVSHAPPVRRTSMSLATSRAHTPWAALNTVTSGFLFPPPRITYTAWPS
jgi:hypothetical protein